MNATQPHSPASHRLIELHYKCEMCGATANVRCSIGRQAPAMELKSFACLRCAGFPPLTLEGIVEVEQPRIVAPQLVIPNDVRRTQ